MGIGLLRKIKELSVLRQEYMIHELGSGRVAFSPLLIAGYQRGHSYDCSAYYLLRCVLTFEFSTADEPAGSS